MFDVFGFIILICYYVCCILLLWMFDFKLNQIVALFNLQPCIIFMRPLFHVMLISCEDQISLESKANLKAFLIVYLVYEVGEFY